MYDSIRCRKKLINKYIGSIAENTSSAYEKVFRHVKADVIKPTNILGEHVFSVLSTFNGLEFKRSCFVSKIVLSFRVWPPGIADASH